MANPSSIVAGYYGEPSHGHKGIELEGEDVSSQMPSAVPAEKCKKNEGGPPTLMSSVDGSSAVNDDGGLTGGMASKEEIIAATIIGEGGDNKATAWTIWNRHKLRKTTKDRLGKSGRSSGGSNSNTTAYDFPSRPSWKIQEESLPQRENLGTQGDDIRVVCLRFKQFTLWDSYNAGAPRRRGLDSFSYYGTPDQKGTRGPWIGHLISKAMPDASTPDGVQGVGQEWSADLGPVDGNGVALPHPLRAVCQEDVIDAAKRSSKWDSIYSTYAVPMAAGNEPPGPDPSNGSINYYNPKTSGPKWEEQ